MDITLQTIERLKKQTLIGFNKHAKHLNITHTWVELQSTQFDVSLRVCGWTDNAIVHTSRVTGSSVQAMLRAFIAHVQAIPKELTESDETS